MFKIIKFYYIIEYKIPKKFDLKLKILQLNKNLKY